MYFQRNTLFFLRKKNQRTSGRCWAELTEIVDPLAPEESVYDTDTITEHDFQVVLAFVLPPRIETCSTFEWPKSMCSFLTDINLVAKQEFYPNEKHIDTHCSPEQLTVPRKIDTDSHLRSLHQSTKPVRPHL